MSGQLRATGRLRAFAKWLRAALPAGGLVDSTYSALRYMGRHLRVPRYRRPRLFNDYLYRLRNDGSLLSPLRQFVTDKEYVKYYIAGVVGWQHTLRTLAVVRTETEVDLLRLSEFPCVLKPSHMSGEVIILREQEERLHRAILRRWINTDYYKVSREPNYRYLEPKVIVEEFFVEKGVSVPRDFKIHCFCGVPRLIQVDSGRFTSHTRNFYDTCWRRLDIEWAFPRGETADAKPKCLGLMLEIAGRLASTLSYVRVDMYTDDVVVKVGEMTSCPGGARSRIRPRAAEVWLGRLWGGGGEPRAAPHVTSFFSRD